MENQEQLKPHLRIKVEVLDYKPFTNDQTKRASTMVKSVMTFPDGKRSAVEFWLDGHQHFNGPDWIAEIRIGADYKNRFEARVIRLVPVSAVSTGKPAGQ